MNNDDVLVIRGSGTILEGEYDIPVKVYGSLKVDGDFIVKSLECYGTANIEGDLEVEEDLKVRGSLKTNDLVINGNCSISGGVKILGDLECSGKIELDGGADMDGDLECSYLVVKGGLRTSGDIKVSNDCEIHGGIRVGGDMRIEGTLVMDVSGRGRTRIEGNVEVNRDLEIKTRDEETKIIIDGDIVVYGTANIENTEIAGVLKATNIILGKNVLVKNDVYYVEKIDTDPASKIIGKVIRISSVE